MPVPTPHIEAKKGEIAKNVLMPGDPLRAKYVAEHFLEDARLVNQVRNVYAYTGTCLLYTSQKNVPKRWREPCRKKCIQTLPLE